MTKETRDMILSDIPGLPPIHALDLPMPYLEPVMYAWMREYHLKFRRADVILINTFYDIEKPVLDTLRNEVIGTPDMQVSANNE